MGMLPWLGLNRKRASEFKKMISVNQKNFLFFLFLLLPDHAGLDTKIMGDADRMTLVNGRAVE